MFGGGVAEVRLTGAAFVALELEEFSKKTFKFSDLLGRKENVTGVKLIYVGGSYQEDLQMLESVRKTKCDKSEVYNNNNNI